MGKESLRSSKSESRVKEKGNRWELGEEIGRGDEERDRMRKRGRKKGRREKCGSRELSKEEWIDSFGIL